jgi:hydroxymethylglutaryl-CoA lyase
MIYVECPRDAWQGIKQFIPTAHKINHLKKLIKAGFTHLDCGSFVSSHAVPQMADTEAVLAALPATSADLLCIIANQKGLTRALACEQAKSVGYPLSISDTFQQRNTNQTLENAWGLVQEIQSRAEHLRFVVYLSMGFGNPYNDPWDTQIVLESIMRLRQMGVQNIVIADTYGVANVTRVYEVTDAVIKQFGTNGIGVHLHARAEDAVSLCQAAIRAGITWLEGTLGGIGGCPFAGDELIGNLPTELVLPLIPHKINLECIPALTQNALEVQTTYK